MTQTELEIENEALKAELEKLKRGERVITDSFIEAGVDMLDEEIPFADFLKEDGTYHTIRSKCAISNRAYILNPDGTRFMFGYELSSVHEVHESLKALAVARYGREIGGTDFTEVGDKKMWILNYSQRNQFMTENPNWNTGNEATEGVSNA